MRQLAAERSFLSQGLFHSQNPCRQTNEEGAVVGLNFGVVSGAVTAYFTALGATVDDDIAVAVLDIRLGADGLELAAAGIGAITGVDIDVKRPQAKGTVITGGIAERQDLFSAMRTNKAVVVFCKPFLVHAASERKNYTIILPQTKKNVKRMRGAKYEVRYTESEKRSNF